jgi:hypothetical protein
MIVIYCVIFCWRSSLLALRDSALAACCGKRQRVDKAPPRLFLLCRQWTLGRSRNRGACGTRLPHNHFRCEARALDIPARWFVESREFDVLRLSVAVVASALGRIGARFWRHGMLGPFSSHITSAAARRPQTVSLTRPSQNHLRSAQPQPQPQPLVCIPFLHAKPELSTPFPGLELLGVRG